MFSSSSSNVWFLVKLLEEDWFLVKLLALAAKTVYVLVASEPFSFNISGPELPPFPNK